MRTLPEESVLQRRIRERKEQIAREEAAKKAAEQPQFDEDLVPSDQYERSDEDKEMDRVIESIDIIDAYRRWCGKSHPNPRSGQTEGIKVSCPKPDHPDRDPSAWINTRDQVWFCGGCQEGGDAYDIAAYHFGFSVPGYKSGVTFHQLRQKMAESYGYTFITAPGLDKPVMVAPEPDSSPGVVEGRDNTDTSDKSHLSVVPSSQPADAADEADVVDIAGDEDITWPTLDWQNIVPDDTFLSAYMGETIKDDVAEEYHFWNALLALGFALGRDVVLDDLLPVHGNLFVCTLGHSGAGKSKARYHLDSLLHLALPYNHSDDFSKGVRKISAPGSAEVLIHNFSKPVMDPADPKKISFYAPVRGLIDFNELSALVSRSNRQGNATKPTLMQFYDMESVISTSSMSTGMKEAFAPFGSALTTTQPRAISTLLHQSDADSGFLNRWVFAAGPEKERVAIGGVSVDMSSAVDPLQKVAGWAGAFGIKRRMTWSEPAADLFTKFFHAEIEPDKKRDDTGMLVRLDLLMKKLILLLSANQKHTEVQVQTVEHAIKMYPYLIDCYAILSGKIGNTIQSELREEILRHVVRLSVKGASPTANDLMKRMKRKKYPLDLVAKTLKYMCDLGELQAIVAKGPGRPTVRYKHVG